MELDDVVRNRRMCRDFLSRALPDGLVDRLLDRARRAPSAGNTQGWSFLVLEDSEAIARFWSTDADPTWLAAPDHPGLLRAPAIVVPWCRPAAYAERYGRPDKRRPRDDDRADATRRGEGPAGWSAPYWYIDTAFAVMLLLLGAEAEGIGALFFRLHGAPAALRAAFGVPAGWEPLGAVALGWPAPTGTAGRPGRDGSDAEQDPKHRPRPLRLEEIVHRDGW